jgi:hypothetical protein
MLAKINPTIVVMLSIAQPHATESTDTTQRPLRYCLNT